MELRRIVVLNCTIACFLLSSNRLFAQTAQSAQTAEEMTLTSAPLAVSHQGVPSDSVKPSTTAEAAPYEDRQAGQQVHGGDPGTEPNDPTGTTVGTAGTTAGVATGAAAVSTYTFPTARQMAHYWLRNTVGPRAFIGGAFTASWNTWVITSPTEWHRNASGWGKRLGSSLLDNSINQSSLVLLSRAMGQDPMYYRCACSGLGPRLGHAIKMTFIARNRNGDAVFAPAKLIAPFTGPLVTRDTLYPDRFGPSNAMSGAAYYLAGGVAWSIIREFVWKSPRW